MRVWRCGGVASAIRGAGGVGKVARAARNKNESMLTGLTQAHLSLRYAAFRARRRLRALAEFADCADRTWNVADAAPVMTEPALCLSGQAEKIKTLFDTTWEVERQRIAGGRVERKAVVGYELSNAALVYGSILCKRSEKRVIPHDRGPRPSKLSPVVDAKRGALSASYLGLLYFGHWLRDDSALELLASEYGETVSLPPPSEWVHCDDYRRVLDLKSRVVGAARFKKLVIFDDEDFSPHKAARFQMLRARAAQLGNGGGHSAVFLSRGLRDGGGRAFNNEAEIAEALAADGFTILDPMKASVQDFARVLGGADLVVGPEGSQFAHAALFLRPGAGLLAITSPHRFVTSHKRWCDAIGVRYGFVVPDDREGGLNVNIDELKRTIDLFGV